MARWSTRVGRRARPWTRPRSACRSGRAGQSAAPCKAYPGQTSYVTVDGTSMLLRTIDEPGKHVQYLCAQNFRGLALSVSLDLNVPGTNDRPLPDAAAVGGVLAVVRHLHLFGPDVADWPGAAAVTYAGQVGLTDLVLEVVTFLDVSDELRLHRIPSELCWSRSTTAWRARNESPSKTSPTSPSPACLIQTGTRPGGSTPGPTAARRLTVPSCRPSRTNELIAADEAAVAIIRGGNVTPRPRPHHDPPARRRADHIVLATQADDHRRLVAAFRESAQALLTGPDLPY